MSDDPLLEPRRKLVCVSCGEWILAHDYGDAWYCAHCGGSMVETFRDPAFLDLDRNLKLLWREIVVALRLEEILEWLGRKVERVTRRWRRTDTS